MNKVKRLLLPVLISSLSFTPALAAIQRAKYLKAIEVVVKHPNDQFPKRKWGRLAQAITTVELEPGEEIGGQEILLHLYPGAKHEFRIEQRFETSLAVSNEGPHLDLLDWKHHYSPWRTLQPTRGNRFLIAAISQEESSRFPAVTAEEIRWVVKQAAGEGWAELVRDVRHPNDAPCYVALSKISLRISVKEGKAWRQIHQLDCLVPMGC
jgi:hypothetical protein